MAEKEAVSLRFEAVLVSPRQILDKGREKTAEVKDRGVFNVLRSIPVKMDLIKVKF